MAAALALVSTASVRTDLICRPSGLYTFPPYSPLCFSITDVKTDTLTYRHVGLGKVSSLRLTSQSPQMGNSSAGLSGWWPFSCPGCTACTDRPPDPSSCQSQGMLATGAHLTGRATPHSEEGNNFFLVPGTVKGLPKSWALDCFWSRMSDEVNDEDRPHYRYTLWVIKISHRL